jgi:hypothetical protein
MVQIPVKVLNDTNAPCSSAGIIESLSIKGLNLLQKMLQKDIFLFSMIFIAGHINNFSLLVFNLYFELIISNNKKRVDTVEFQILSQSLN